MHRRVMLQASETGTDAELHVALFNTRATKLRVIDAHDDTLATVMLREKCIAGVNGGYFDTDRAAMGLVVSEGSVISRLRKARLLTGVLCTPKDTVQLLRLGEFALKRAGPNALQCGPFLVDGGKPVAGLEKTRAARRTFVAVFAGNRAALGYCSAVTLGELAEILTTRGTATNETPARAVNLDGGSSSAFWCATTSGTVSIPEQKAVRNFVAVTPRH